MNDIPIELKSISKTFNRQSKYPTKALRDVSFLLTQGEITGLIGPNGAGKTTLLRVILGFLDADEGDVKIFGNAPHSIEARAICAYQADSHYRAKTVSVNSYLKINALLAGLEVPLDQIIKMLEEFHLMKSRKKSLMSLSEGMRQKIELINCFLGKPRLVLLDEPTAALDPPSVIELRDFILKRKDEGVTVLFSSHHLAEVEKLCDRAIFISNGKIFGDYSLKGIDTGFLEQEFRKYASERE